MAEHTEKTNNDTTKVDGRILYYSFLAGANQLLQHQAEINKLNVFPVNDKDTGTNLAATVRSVLDNIQPHKFYKTMVNDMAEAALVGARGNSGVIFAQFLYGLSCETKDKATLTITEFAESVCRSVPYMYGAISNPLEGTMLTVIKEWAEFLHAKRENIHEFKKVIIDSLSVLEKSLSETTFKLKALHKSGFVDAGAKGFVVFIKGVTDFLRAGDVRQLAVLSQATFSFIPPEHIVDDEITYRYCTEAIIKNLSVGRAEIQKIASKSGDSLVVAGSEATCRIHIHTNRPAELFQELKACGTITFQKVDDMIRQQETATKRKWNIALVTDSSCDLSQELIDFYQINVVPLNLNFADNHFLDKVTIKPDRFYDMLESETEFPKTSQINEQTFTNLYSHLASHYDAIIAIHLTGQFSGTFANSAKAGKRISKEFDKPIYVIDSKNLSGALGLLVLKAAKSIEAGQRVDAVVRTLADDIMQTKIFVSVRDLKYMIKGGAGVQAQRVYSQSFGIQSGYIYGRTGKIAVVWQYLQPAC
ncbi:DegV family protein [Bacteroides sp.]|uniref:DegV family protein n=1 Tax=Bacteroides sp. TaxID=29523 RepID=UPI0025B97871|nr:DegV family protein [Bacteroides sp.]